MLWIATQGERVAGVMDLDARQRELTLPEYEAARCDECGRRGVETYERSEARVCAPCDGVAS